MVVQNSARKVMHSGLKGLKSNDIEIINKLWLIYLLPSLWPVTKLKSQAKFCGTFIQNKQNKQW